MAGLIGKGIYIQGICWEPQEKQLSAPITRILTGFSPVHHPDGLKTPYSFKAVSLQQLLRVGKAGGMHIPRLEVKGQKPWITWVHLAGQPIVMASW